MHTGPLRIWSKEEFLRRYKLCRKTIHDIELTADKTRRLEWRNLQKVRRWMEDHFWDYEISDEDIKEVI